MVVAPRLDTPERKVIGQQPAFAWFEAISGGLLLLLTVVFNTVTGQPWPSLMLDVAACIAVILTARYPRAAGIALAGCLAVGLTFPTDWGTLGEYAPLLAVIGAGMRGRLRIQAAMIGGYGLLLVLITVQDAPSAVGALIGCLAWLLLLVLAWLIGHAFAVVGRAHARLRIAESVLQRERLARQLHDTTARSLVVVARLAARIRQRGSATPDELEMLATAAEKANDQLRQVMNLLNDPTGQPEPITPESPSLTEALDAGRVLLEQHGFAPVVAVRGALESLSAGQSKALREAADEAFANIVKHGDPKSPATVTVAVAHSEVELEFTNVQLTGRPVPAGSQLGLGAMRQRLATMGGTVTVHSTGTAWQTRVLLPIDRLQQSERAS